MSHPGAHRRAEFQTQPRLLQELLEEMKAEGAEECVRREKSGFDTLAAPFRDIVLFGAGPLGRGILEGLRRVEVEPLAFADNNRQLWDSQVQGVKVLSPAEAVRRYGERAAFVVTIYNGSSARQQLQELGCRKVLPFLPLLWKYSQVFIPTSGVDLPHFLPEQAEEIAAGYSVLGDDVSRREFCAQLRWRYWLDYKCLPPALEPQHTYFPADLFSALPDEVFLDCGAFDGDSIRSFLAHRGNVFGSIMGLEPDPDNRRRFSTYVAGLPEDLRRRIHLLPYAVGNENRMVTFEATSTAGSRITSEGQSSEVECRRLDDLGWPSIPTFIKMDIEGAEPEALQGAAGLLRRYRPVLAICVYHRSEHLWRIPNLIHSLAGDYRIFLRRYAEECWELVCYAVPEERLLQPAGKLQ